MKFDWKIFATRQVISAVVAAIFSVLGEWVRPGLLGEIRPHVVEILVALFSSTAAVDLHAFSRARKQSADEYMHWRDGGNRLG